MPKSKRAKVFNLTQVSKKNREQKEKLFQNIRDAVPEYQHCFVFSVDNMRNNHLKEVRHELSDSRYVVLLPPSSQLAGYPTLFARKERRGVWRREDRIAC